MNIRLIGIMACSVTLCILPAQNQRGIVITPGMAASTTVNIAPSASIQRLLLVPGASKASYAQIQFYIKAFCVADEMRNMLQAQGYQVPPLVFHQLLDASITANKNAMKMRNQW